MEYAKYPYLFRQPQFKEMSSIIIPRVSSVRREYIPIGTLDSNTIASDAAMAIYSTKFWIIGVLMSKLHMCWVKAIGGKLKNDYRYSNTLCYNTFPFPPISFEKQIEIKDAAEEILCIRAEHSERTLSELYDPNKMPTDLFSAHHLLDLIIESCYRKDPFKSDEERLEHLFKLYEKMTNQNSK